MHRFARRPRLAAVPIAIAGLLALGASGAAAADVTVDMVAGNAFSPSSVTIDVGDRVTWRNVDPGIPHNVADNGGRFDSGLVSTGGTFAHTYTSAGTFPYVCQFHPPGMVGTVVVRAAAAPTATTGGTGGSGGAGGAGGSGGSAPTAPNTSTVSPAPAPDQSAGAALVATLALLGATWLVGLAAVRRRLSERG